MTCDQAIELLPWLLNGTLEPQERDEVRQRGRRHIAQQRVAWPVLGVQRHGHLRLAHQPGVVGRQVELAGAARNPGTAADAGQPFVVAQVLAGLHDSNAALRSIHHLGGGLFARAGEGIQAQPLKPA